MQALALKYRPKTFEDVTEQSIVTEILQMQVDNEEVKQAYVFVGAAGTGKTTCARIFANMINKGEGGVIEMDAASNNSVDNVREIQKMAQTRALDGEYKIFILDEVHLFSAGAWAAMLKLIEEPPAKSIFILCTTDYWKIPKTIISRCERFDFKRISVDGITERLTTICHHEDVEDFDEGALNYIARLSDGCMREAIMNLDKLLSLYDEITEEAVAEALGTVTLDQYIQLTDDIVEGIKDNIITDIEEVYNAGEDMKQYIKGYVEFLLDVMKYDITDSFEFTKFPDTKKMRTFCGSMLSSGHKKIVMELLDTVIRLDTEIKFSQNPKAIIEARMLIL